jgi:hypothetical protein
MKVSLRIGNERGYVGGGGTVWAGFGPETLPLVPQVSSSIHIVKITMLMQLVHDSPA